MSFSLPFLSSEGNIIRGNFLWMVKLSDILKFFLFKFRYKIEFEVDECYEDKEKYGNESTKFDYDCPDRTGAKISISLYVGYLLFMTILLVNLLIAIFKYLFFMIVKKKL
jgi:hypothetical protein